MFNLFVSMKKRLFGDTAKKETCEQEFSDSLGSVIGKRKERERKAFELIVEKFPEWESMSDAELNGLIQKGAREIYEEEKREDLKKKRALRSIKTLRTKEEIQNAINAGQKVLKQKVIPSKKIQVTDVYIKNLDTGEVYTRPYSYSAIVECDPENREMVKKKTYYPYTFPLKIAAYVLPDDLQEGERVLIEDLIEDIVGASHSEGTYRLESLEAVWDGLKFVVDCDSYDVKITFG